MAEKKLLGTREMKDVDRRLGAMGRELYRLIEDYPILDRPDWGYMASLLFLHQQILNEAMSLKRAGMARK